MAKDERTQQQKLHDRVKPTGNGRQRDAQKQGETGKSKR